MLTFRELYESLLRQAVEKKPDAAMEEDFDPHHLDCLLNPEKYPPVLRLGGCTCSDAERESCYEICDFDAVSHDSQGNARIEPERCVGCSACILHCPKENLTASKDVLPVLDLLRQADSLVYAVIAPAFISQFSEQVTPGKIRSAFKKLGFAGMIEVALFADILTVKEAYEFDRHIETEDDFMLTSCCCPIWIALIRKGYHQLISKVPPSVSPMVACGRSIKLLYPEAKTVFIGPCVAKKAEAREPDIRDAIDHVLTFQEIVEIFGLVGIDPASCEEDERDHSSAAGRKYARVQGVSDAVQATVNRIRPDRPIPLRAIQGDGMPSCKAMLARLTTEGLKANFIEGMGCVGGCVGGPKILINRDEGRRAIDRYSREATYLTPVDNPYVIELMHRLGFDTPESLLEGGHLFNRNL